MLKADPSLWHYAKPLDRNRLLQQYGAFTDLVEKSGANIEWMASNQSLADSVFTYDPSLVIADGAVVLRPGKQLREPEAQLHQQFYERLGVPLLGTITAPGTVEGGDCFWIDDQTMAVGRGFRSNQEGISQLKRILAVHGVTVESFDLPVWDGDSACLHLMSLVSPLDHDLALVYRRLLPVALYQLLCERGVSCLEAPDQEFAASKGLNLNVLATAPRQCIAVAGFPETAGLMSEAGCEVSLFAADDLCIPCEGGPTCMTRPILRG